MILAKHLGTGNAVYELLSSYLEYYSSCCYLPGESYPANTDNHDLIDEEMDYVNKNIKLRLGPSQVLTDVLIHLWLSDLDAEIRKALPGLVFTRRAHELFLFDSLYPSFHDIQDLLDRLNLKYSFQFLKAGYPPAECRGGSLERNSYNKVHFTPNSDKVRKENECAMECLVVVGNTKDLVKTKPPPHTQGVNLSSKVNSKVKKEGGYTPKMPQGGV